jgi:hypothetical protein
MLNFEINAGSTPKISPSLMLGFFSTQLGTELVFFAVE